MQSSTLNAFLEVQKAAFVERGTVYMEAVIDDAIASDLPSLEALLERQRDLRSKCAKFDIDFMYHWSVMTYWVDMISRYKQLMTAANQNTMSSK